MTASDFDRDRAVIFLADTREESIYTALAVPYQPSSRAHVEEASGSLRRSSVARVHGSFGPRGRYNAQSLSCAGSILEVNAAVTVHLAQCTQLIRSLSHG